MNAKKTKTTVYTKRSRSLKESISGAIRYRDLIGLLARRNLTVKYKQTILGPLWLIIMPFVETLVSAFVFGNIAKLGSGTVPYFLFFYVGSTLWYLFSSCVSGTGTTFVTNAKMFQKTYFPRLVMPFSTILSNLVTFFVRFVLMCLVILAFALFVCPVTIEWDLLWLVPIVLLIVLCLALGIGLIFSALTAKYRDLSALLPVMIDLLKYVTPVVYMVKTVDESIKTICLLNPMAPLIEAFRAIFLGIENGMVSGLYLGYSTLFACALLMIGLLLFNRSEKSFVDVL